MESNNNNNSNKVYDDFFCRHLVLKDKYTSDPFCMLNDSNIFAGIYIHNCILHVCYIGNHLMYILDIHLIKNSIVKS